MLLEAKSVRQGKKVISSNCKTGIGVDELFSIIESEVIFE
jgi:Ni2+-binding GTPase involved in maturation of urease and hydrogenase